MEDGSNSEVPRFDWSQMILLNDPAHGGKGGGPGQPPFIVLTSEPVLEARPALKPYRVEGQPTWSAWAGGQPEPVYLFLPDNETLLATVGDPHIHHLQATDVRGAPAEVRSPTLGVFDEAAFDNVAFDTGSPLQVDDATSLSEATNVRIGVGTGSASGAGTAQARTDAFTVTPEVAHAISARLQSADWTGIERRIEALPGAVGRVGILVVELDRIVEQCGLTNIEHQKAKALTGALLKLVSSPQPEWPPIISILTSPTLTALLNVQALALVMVAISKVLLGE